MPEDVIHDGTKRQEPKSGAGCYGACLGNHMVDFFHLLYAS